MTADVVELTRQVAALTKRVEELERGVTVHVRDGCARVSSTDGTPVVVHRAEFVIEETPDE